jgi:hypothetical protein
MVTPAGPWANPPDGPAVEWYGEVWCGLEQAPGVGAAVRIAAARLSPAQWSG